MADNAFVLIGVLIIVSGIVAMVGTPLVAGIFGLEGRTRVVLMVALFAIVLVLAYGGYRVLWGAGAATIAFHEKQAQQFPQPVLAR